MISYMNKSQNVYVNFFNQMNYGDDVFVMMLAKKYPHIFFHINGSLNKLEAFKDQRNIVIHEDNNLSNIIKKISLKICGKDIVYALRARKCKCCVTIGGSIFIEPNGYIKEYFRDKNSKILSRKKNIVMGANFGPYTNDQFREFFNEYFKKMDFVSFRDKYSYEIFKQNSKVNYAPDILFGITDVFNVEKKVQKPYIVISVIDKAKDREKYLKKVSEMIKYYLTKNYEVVLMSMCEAQADLKLCYELAEGFDTNKVRVVSYSGNVSEIMGCIKNAAYLIGSRFHAIVSSICYEVPCYPIVYSDKTENLLLDIAYEGQHTTVDEFCDISIDLVDMNRKQNYKPDVKQMIRNSEKHFSYLDEYFEKTAK